MSQNNETKKVEASREVKALGAILRRPRPREKVPPVERETPSQGVYGL